jgi:hypothetical protein
VTGRRVFRWIRVDWIRVMDSPLFLPWLGRIACCAGLLFQLNSAWAHHCGESPVTVEVGRTIAYRIVADLS